MTTKITYASTVSADSLLISPHEQPCHLWIVFTLSGLEICFALTTLWQDGMRLWKAQSNTTLMQCKARTLSLWAVEGHYQHGTYLAQLLTHWTGLLLGGPVSSTGLLGHSSRCTAKHPPICQECFPSNSRRMSSFGRSFIPRSSRIPSNALLSEQKLSFNSLLLKVEVGVTFCPYQSLPSSVLQTSANIVQ